jgi:DNA-binding NtrC family response regulator
MPKKSPGPDVIRHLQAWPWPRKIRQLQHAVERATIFADGDCLAVENFEQWSTESGFEPSGFPDLSTDPPLSKTGIRVAKEKVELDHIKEALARHNGNKKRVTEVLGMSRSYLCKRLKELDVG